MTSDLESLKDTKTILLTTFKRDGAPVATPVSIAFDHDRAFFRSYDKAWKTQRLREAEIPAGKEVHAILDNLQVDKTPEITHWLEDHPRWTFHFTPTHASWLNQIELFFSILTRWLTRRGIFTSKADLRTPTARLNRALQPDRPAVRLDLPGKPLHA